MFREYIQAALEQVQYKVMDNGDEPYFADVPELDGVWATGSTVEDARRNFIAARLQWGLPISQIDGQTIEVSKEPVSIVQARPPLTGGDEQEMARGLGSLVRFQARDTST